ncbi:MAG: hypothetical protein QMD46_01840 [Methanomicrobiales archaeon]|nr:hypothetical protein [Methanomicrobiales archaeon]MDI6875182.1 hypothetical protein [Methanomicrobiales archaeon]
MTSVAAPYPLPGSYLSAADLYTLLQLTDMAVAALERQDFVQLDAALTRICGIRRRYGDVRRLVDSLSRRRSITPAGVPHD